MMKKLFFSCLVALSFTAQSQQDSTNKDCDFCNFYGRLPTENRYILQKPSYSEFREILDLKLDYLMVCNMDSVNVTYYEDGLSKQLAPISCMYAESSRNEDNSVLEWANLFLDALSFRANLYVIYVECSSCTVQKGLTRFGYETPRIRKGTSR
jgi:hypothetical protein